MPLSTRTIAKGIPPRGHLPKSKKAGSKSSSQKNAKNRKNKRTADSDSDAGKESDDETSDIEPVVKKKKSSKRQHIEESEIEVISKDAVPSEEVEEVDDDGKSVENEESEVSMTCS